MTVLESSAPTPLLETGFELVAGTQVLRVHDAEHARDLLRRRLRGPCDDDVLRRTAEALARGEILLVRSELDRPLDPPDFEAVPLLSTLAGGAS